MNAANDAATVTVRSGGELAARDAAALLLALAPIVEAHAGPEHDLHPDLYRSLVERLQSTGAELAAAFGQHDLIDTDGPPVEGAALAKQLAAVLRESARDRHDADDRRGDLEILRSSRPELDNIGDHVTDLLDRSGNESFPASDPPSL